MLKILTDGVLIDTPIRKTGKEGRTFVQVGLRVTGWHDRPMPGRVRLYGFDAVGTRLACLSVGESVHVSGYGQIDGAGSLHIRCVSVETEQERYQMGCRMLRQLRDSLIVQKPGEGIF